MPPIVSEDYKEKKKLSLLQAARRVFVRKGFIQTTMQDIIDEANVSRGALYAYFSNLEHVYLELLRVEDQQDLLYFEPSDSGSSWEQLLQWINDQQVGLQNGRETLVRANSEFFLSIQDSKEKESLTYIARRYERIIEALSVFFQRGATKGEFNPRLPADSIARCFVSFMDGILLNSSHLGAFHIKAQEQLDALVVTLEALLCPAKLEERMGK